MMIKTLFAFVLAAMTATCCFSQGKEVPLIDRTGHGEPHGSCVPTVTEDCDDVTIKCDSTLYNVEIVIRDRHDAVMHQSTQPVGPEGTTIHVPDAGDDREKATIDLYYDRKHQTGFFEE